MAEDQGLAGPEQPLTAAGVRTVPAVLRADRFAACPACGQALRAGQDVVTTLGDVRRGAIGVTVHQRCATALGPAGLLDLMVAAFTRGQD